MGITRMMIAMLLTTLATCAHAQERRPLNLELPKRSAVYTPFVYTHVKSAQGSDLEGHDPTSYAGWSVSLYGASHHTRTKTNFNESHPGFGIRKHFGACFFGLANCYAEGTYINQNSLRGETYLLSGGAWFHFANIDNYRIGLSETISVIHYKNPTKHEHIDGIIHMPAISFGKNDWDLELGVLTKDFGKWLKGEERAIYFLLCRKRWK